jgi:pimeloyl-ACP methyl ester carboxylesterase
MSRTPSPGPLKSHISPDIFLHVPASLSSPSSRTTRPLRIIFFVTGNPGLIAYYHAFLSLLSTSRPTQECIIAGFSLGGFEIGDEDRDASPLGLQGLQFPDASPRPGKIYGLQEQIELAEQRVRALARSVPEEYADDADRSSDADGNGRRDGPTPAAEVILLGHSVGAYIVLELIRRHAQQQQQQQQQRKVNFAIKAAILLTPTVVDIAQSASGRILMPLVTYVPGFAALVDAAAQGMVGVLRRAWLKGLVRWVTGIPDVGGEAGMSALDATVAFLRSGRGVRQALEMAGEEMRTISEDVWGDEVWGGVEDAVAIGARGMVTNHDGGGDDDDDDGKGVVEWNVQVGERPPKLVFYFAKTDHWVADQTREELLRVRGRLEGKGEDWRPKMVVDDTDGLVHGWCIGQSELVAGKVGKWIAEIWGDVEDAKQATIDV